MIYKMKVLKSKKMDQRSMDNLIESYLDAMRFEKHLDSIKYNRNMY